MHKKIMNSNSFKIELVKNAQFVGKYEFPLIKPTNSITEKAIPFDKAVKTIDKKQWVHFFIDDHRFEIMWNNPNKYLSVLKEYDGVISPDFSVYSDMPLAMQIWNTYRNRVIAHWLQQNGIDVIPNVRWGDERTYEFCFDGIPKNSTVAVSTNGCIQNKLSRYYFKQGLQVMADKLVPQTIVNYSNMPNDIFLPYIENGINIIQIPNWNSIIKKKVPN